jgi:twinkle protein
MEGHVYLYVRPDAPPEDELIGVMRFCRQELGCYLFVVDSLMKAIPGTDDYNRQKNFCNRLAMESRDSGIHIALVAHTRKSQRDTDTQDRMDIRGAGEISDLADAVGILNRNREQERKMEVEFDYTPTEPDAFLRIAKQRHGSGWEGNIGLYFDQASQTFLDVEGQRAVSHVLRGETRSSEQKEPHTKGDTVAGVVSKEVRDGSF